MSKDFKSPFAEDLQAYLRFKRSLGYLYVRAEATLQEFDRFVSRQVQENGTPRLDRVILAWLSSKHERKAISVSRDAAVLRGFCNYLKRMPGRNPIRMPLWPQLPNEAEFRAFFLSKADICQLLGLAAKLQRPTFRAALYRALLLVLYCTGIRFGEALRLRMVDVDTRARVLFVRRFKRRARWVPFKRSLSRELDKYLKARRIFAPALMNDHFFVGANRKTLPANTASETLRDLFRKAALKPQSGRIGPRPYDFRHAFAIHRLALWYRQRCDLHSRLPWLSAYMGHNNILGTQTYLSATPELLALAGSRMRHRYLHPFAAGINNESEKAKHSHGFGSELFPQLPEKCARRK